MARPFKTRATTVHDASIWTGSTYMDLLDPNPAEIRLEDIARALSRLARYNGHGRHFYSVAEHSVHCLRVFKIHAHRDVYSDPVLKDIARDILMHDAAEAYLGDVTRPLKVHLPEYCRIEDRMDAAIAARFNLAGSAPEWVKQCDLEMMAVEKAVLMPETGDWPVLDGVTPPPILLWLLTPEQAMREFLEEAFHLGLHHGPV